MPRKKGRPASTRDWSIAIEADEEMTADDIAAAISMLPCIKVVNVEEIETSYTEEEDDDDDVPR